MRGLIQDKGWMQMRARVEVSRAAALMQLVVENY